MGHYDDEPDWYIKAQQKQRAETIKNNAKYDKAWEKMRKSKLGIELDQKQKEFDLLEEEYIQAKEELENFHKKVDNMVRKKVGFHVY